MSRRFVVCILMQFLLAAVSWAADPFLGTWTADMVKMRQEFKDLPPGAVGDSIKVEAYKSGYKITQTIRGNVVNVTTVDFLAGVTSVRNAKGKEIDRVKVVRKSATEIETTSVQSRVVLDYRVVSGGNEIEIKISNWNDGKPPLNAYYKRVS